MAPKDVLVRHPKNFIPLWGDSYELLWLCEDIIFSLASTTPILSDSPSTLAHPIVWRSPDAGIILVEVFGGIGT
jgi:hypothetical protein